MKSALTTGAALALTLQAATVVAADSTRAEYVSTPQVVGGQEVTPGLFPFLVRIESTGGLVCTGSLIASRWVLTAAHCEQPARVYITDAMPPAAGPNHVVWWLAPEQWIPHESYVPSTFKNDIALIELVDDATQYPPTNNGVPLYQPAAIGLGTSPSSTASSIGNLVIAGFGLTIPDDNESAPLIVNWASEIPSFSSTACDPFFPASVRPLNPQQQLCFGTYPHTCQGDSGGAVFKASQVYGVVSFGGLPCGNGPTVATYVPGYIGWINTQISGPAPTPKASPQPTPKATAPPNPITLGWELPPKKADGVASGIGNVQGYAFSSEGSIKSVEFYVDGKKEATIPCCSERKDVKDAIPGAPLKNAFSGVMSYGRFTSGNHAAKLVVADTAGNKLEESRQITTVNILPGIGFARDPSFEGADCKFDSPDTFSCTGVEFAQGSCKGKITFRWLNGKQGLEVVDGCD